MKNKGQVIPSQSRSYVQWNDAMDEVLTQVLLDQANQENKADGDWKAQAYQAVMDQVRITLGNILTKDNVRNRLRQWKKQYAVISDIQNRSRVSFWDEEKKKVVVTTENASDWQNYLKVKLYFNLFSHGLMMIIKNLIRFVYDRIWRWVLYDDMTFFSL
ncbi:hypothetical protein LINPERHAP2_LOCUS41811 [Linum perenne]